MIGLVLTIIGYAFVGANIIWRAVRVPVVNVQEQDMRILADTVIANGALLFGYIAPYAPGTSNATKAAAFLLLVIGLVLMLVTLAADIKFTHIDK